MTAAAFDDDEKWLPVKHHESQSDAFGKRGAKPKRCERVGAKSFRARLWRAPMREKGLVPCRSAGVWDQWDPIFSRAPQARAHERARKSELGGSGVEKCELGLLPLKFFSSWL